MSKRDTETERQTKCVHVRDRQRQRNRSTDRETDKGRLREAERLKTERWAKTCSETERDYVRTLKTHTMRTYNIFSKTNPRLHTPPDALEESPPYRLYVSSSQSVLLEATGNGCVGSAQMSYLSPPYFEIKTMDATPISPEPALLHFLLHTLCSSRLSPQLLTWLC